MAGTRFEKLLWLVQDCSSIIVYNSNYSFVTAASKRGQNCMNLYGKVSINSIDQYPIVQSNF